MRDWSREEVEATVADYFDMLEAEIRRRPYSKSEHRRRLLRFLNDRTDGAVERKHGNISAVLIELGFPYIAGYKPYRNYQALLWQVVSERVANATELVRLIEQEVAAPPTTLAVSDILRAMVEPPVREREQRLVRDSRPPSWEVAAPRVFDFTEQEARNRALGLAGEHFVIEFEKARLISAGHEGLAERVEHVAVTHGQVAGFDVRSFDSNGADRLIEVKTTRYGKETPFLITRNEVAVSERRGDQYHVYRVFEFRRDPRLFDLAGPVSRTCNLDPRLYLASVS